MTRPALSMATPVQETALLLIGAAIELKLHAGLQEPHHAVAAMDRALDLLAELEPVLIEQAQRSRRSQPWAA